MYSIIDKYFILWSFFIPATTVTISSQIPGSLVSYVFAVISPIIIFLYRKKNREKYFFVLILILSIFIFLTCISQLFNEINNITLQGLYLLSEESLNEKMFRRSLITQSLYLIMGFLMFLYSKFFYNEKWDKWIIYSGLFFASYGLYEFIFSLIFGGNGDFLSNRSYTLGEDSVLQGQDAMFAGMYMKRIDSLSMEPSMFSFTLLPYLIFSFYKSKDKKITIFFAIIILLSTSTSAYLGLIIFIVYLLFNKKYIINNKKNIVIIMFFASIIYVIFYDYIYDIISIMIINKLMPIFDLESASNLAGAASGLDRLSNFIFSINYWIDLDFIHQLFGIGFGFHRSTDLFGTLLVNTGVIGNVLFFILNFKNFRLRVRNNVDHMNNIIILSSYIIMMVSVPEFGFPSYWLFLGIIYAINNK